MSQWNGEREAFGHYRRGHQENQHLWGLVTVGGIKKTTAKKNEPRSQILMRWPNFNHWHCHCHQRAPLEFDSLSRFWDSCIQTLSQPNAKTYFGEGDMLTWAESITVPLFCLPDLWVPLYGHVQLGRQLASLGSRLLSDGHSLNRVPPCPVVCAAAHVGTHTSYLCLGNHIPTTLPSSKAARANWGKALGEGARYSISPLHHFLIP